MDKANKTSNQKRSVQSQKGSQMIGKNSQESLATVSVKSQRSKFEKTHDFDVNVDYAK